MRWRTLKFRLVNNQGFSAAGLTGHVYGQHVVREILLGRLMPLRSMVNRVLPSSLSAALSMMHPGLQEVHAAPCSHTASSHHPMLTP